MQVLCAIILSSRAQRSIVKEAIRRLGKVPGGFTAETVSKLDPDQLADICRSVHYHKVCSQYSDTATDVVSHVPLCDLTVLKRD